MRSGKRQRMSTSQLINVLAISDVPQSTLLPYLSYPEQASLLRTCSESASSLKCSLHEAFFKELKGYLVSSDAKGAKDLPFELIKDPTISFSKKCKKIISIFQAELHLYFCKLDKFISKLNINDFFKNKEFNLLVLILKNPIFINELTKPQQELVQKAGIFFRSISSLVKINTTSEDGFEIETAGVVIEKNNQKFILAITQCIQNCADFQVILANDLQKPFTAKKWHVSYECGLAILQVQDPEFDRISQPISLGKMLRLEDKVNLLSFSPELMVTRGLAARIEAANEISQLGWLNLLQVQIFEDQDNLHPGGSIVISGSELAGLSFTFPYGIANPHNICYMIPTPIIEHLLTELFSKKNYYGFPVLPITVSTNHNKPDVIVRSIDSSTDAFKKLKIGDNLLEIESSRIEDEYVFNIPNAGKRIHFSHLTHMKYIGESINLKIQRYNPETKASEIRQVSVILDSVPNAPNEFNYDVSKPKTKKVLLEEKPNLRLGLR